MAGLRAEIAKIRCPFENCPHVPLIRSERPIAALKRAKHTEGMHKSSGELMGPTQKGKLQRRTFWALFVFQLVFAGVVLAQADDVEVVPPAQAQALLKELIPHGKKSVVLNPYVVGKDVNDVNLGIKCASSVCREVHKRYNTLLLGFDDLDDSHAIYLIAAQCVEKSAWNHCDMPAEKSECPIVLEAGKHGSFNIYVATAQKLGGKQKVAKFQVLDVRHARQKDGSQPVAKSEEKQN